jgi:hypothetical protein
MDSLPQVGETLGSWLPEAKISAADFAKVKALQAQMNELLAGGNDNVQHAKQVEVEALKIIGYYQMLADSHIRDIDSKVEEDKAKLSPNDLARIELLKALLKADAAREWRSAKDDFVRPPKEWHVEWDWQTALQNHFDIEGDIDRDWGRALEIIGYFSPGC